MGKRVELPKKAEPKKSSGRFYFFVDQGEGGGKVAVTVLKVLELIVTTIFAFVLGIFGPLCIWNGDIVEAEVKTDPSAVWWLISSIVYVVGMFVMMFGHTKRRRRYTFSPRRERSSHIISTQICLRKQAETVRQCCICQVC